MFILMVLVFVLGYIIIALEHPLKIDKAATALIIGMVCWILYLIGAEGIINSGLSPGWSSFQALHPNLQGMEAIQQFIIENEILHHVGEIAQILFFLMGAMTIVEIVDRHEGFKVITDLIRTKSKVKLLWIISFLTFFLSAVLDNLTTTIVIIALLRKLIDDKHTRWFYASMVVLAANAGGAWSPIGDVTTIMLWIGGQITTLKIIEALFLPSLICMIVPCLFLSFSMKGTIQRPEIDENEVKSTSKNVRILFLIMGVGGLLMVPVLKITLHLPPFMGMLLMLGIIWVTGEIIHRNEPKQIKDKLRVFSIIQRIDIPTVLFFLGILMAVSALQSAGQLKIMAEFLDKNLGNTYLIDIAIGFLSAVVDNVPLVAGAMGMYPIADPGSVGYAANFVQDGLFWEFLAYTAGTGGSMLIIGSAAGVAAMGLEKIDFIWYLKKISLLALAGYLAGAAVYYLEFSVLHIY